MKSLSLFLACIGALSLLIVGCERHDFDSTKVLHLEHGGDHHGESHPEGEHKEAHGDDEKHGKEHTEKADHAEGHEKKEEGEAKPAKEEGRDVGI